MIEPVPLKEAHEPLARAYEIRVLLHEPEYLFALNRASLRRGFFVHFYRHFLDEWHDPAHPYYEFDTGELIYRDGSGRELRREPLRPAEMHPPGAVAALPSGASHVPICPEDGHDPRAH